MFHISGQHEFDFGDAVQYMYLLALTGVDWNLHQLSCLRKRSLKPSDSQRL